VVIDDSPTVRRLLAHLFNADPELEVVGQAEDGLVGWKLISELRPDVVTLDVHMPNMNGPTLLAELMDKLPLPVVMISSQRPEDGPEVLRCLELGAVDYIRKPALQELADQGPRICEIVKAAAGSRIQIKKVAARTPLRKQVLRSVNSQPDSRVLAIGASTGGTEAIKNFLLGLNNHPPATLVVQHIPPVFSRSFADRLNELCPFEVKEAADGDKLMQGRVLIAPGGLQMKLQRSGGSLVVRITDEAPVNRHKPSVDVLFDSVAAVIGPKSMGVILTGMGSDGAAGLLNIRKAGGRSLAQNEQSSVVFGMPKEAIRIGAAEKSGTIDELASWVDRWISQSGEVVKK
jgi:two-component system chemotaxis response regulator CheB